MLAITLGTLACMGLKATAMDDGVPYGRRLPAAVHHVAAGGVLVVACEHVTTTSASLVNTTWLNQESEVISLDSLIDGSLVNIAVSYGGRREVVDAVNVRFGFDQPVAHVEWKPGKIISHRGHRVHREKSGRLRFGFSR